MDLDFGHGFVPRIGQENYKAVDRCIGPADLFTSTPLDLPWAIVDGAWAESRPELLDTLRKHGTRLMVDTFGWRYRYPNSLEISKLRSVSWAPAAAMSVADSTAGEALVRSSLRAQAELAADAYLIPGWLPADRLEDLSPAYERILAAARRQIEDIPPKPMVLFVGGHTKALDQVARLLDQLPHFISGVYLQLTPLAVSKDSPSKLEAVTAICQHASQLGFKVIAGHGGAVAPALRAFGIDAADAGLASGEAFDQSRARQAVKKAESDDKGGGRRARMYFSQIGRSLGATDVERLLAVPGAAAELRGCRLPCHRFRGDHLLDQAREHSLWERVTDAQLVDSLPGSMRATAVYERTRKQRSVLTIINGALEAAGQLPLDAKPIDNQLAWISRSVAVRPAA